MIQRIQSIYLIMVAALSGALSFWLPLWSAPTGEPVYAKDVVPAMTGFGLSAALALIALFLYKQRRNQFVLNRLNILTQLFLLGFFVYRSLNLPGGVSAPEKGIGMLIPVVSVVFLALANRAIKRDEDLVKSVDRLR